MKKTLLIFSLLIPTLFAVAQNGLLGEYYDGTNFEKKIGEKTDSKIDFYWDFTSPMKGMNPEAFSIRWTGKLTAPESGKFIVSLTVDDGVRMWLNGNKIIDAWDMHNKDHFSNYADLEKGKSYDIKIEYFNGFREGMLNLKWELPSEKPFFGGRFGNNEKTIASQFFSSTQPKVVIEEKPKVSPSAVKKTEPKPVIAPKKTPKVVATIPPKDTMQKYTPKNILFEKSTTIMIGDSHSELDRLASMLLRYPNAQLSIEGHTDNIGDADLNLKLSEERAQEVKKYLVQKGVAANRLSSKGFGGSKPLIKTGSDKNRRVEFILKQ